MNTHTYLPEIENKVRKAVETPDANPEFVKQLRLKLVGDAMLHTPAQPTRRLQFNPVFVLAGALLAIVLVASTPAVVKALQQLFGYVPGVGLVDNSPHMRVLDEPVSQTRDGVTLTIENVFVYDERVELIYSVEGIPPMNDGTQADDAAVMRTTFCGGVEIGEMSTHAGDAVLRLPDGEILERDRTGLFPQNRYAMKPVYSASVPLNVMEMTLILDCIPWARLGAVPENWEVPFHLVEIPEGEIVGLPVIEVQQSTEQNSQNSSVGTDNTDIGTNPTQDAVQSDTGQVALPNPQIEAVLEKVVPTSSNMVFYISMHMQNADPSLVSIMPERAYLVDSQGQQIQLISSGPWQPFLHKTGSLFEFISYGNPADGPLTIVIEDAILYYAPLYVDPPQATPEEMGFSFNVGDDPQYGQSWDLDAEYEIGGYPFRVNSVKTVVWDDVAEPSSITGSQGYDYGYQFEIQGDPTVKMSASLDLRSEQCGLWLNTPIFPESSQMTNTIFCREGYPTGDVFAYVRELAVRVENNWQISWTPQ